MTTCIQAQCLLFADPALQVGDGDFLVSSATQIVVADGDGLQFRSGVLYTINRLAGKDILHWLRRTGIQ